MRSISIKRLVLAMAVIGALSASLVLPILGNGSLFAATSSSSGQGLEISPPLIEFSADPGQTISTKIKLRNVTQNNLITKGSVDDFVASDKEDGQPKLLLDANNTSPYSIRAWVKTISDLKILPKEQKVEEVTINIPSDASPGGHYGVIRFAAVPEGLDSTGVALSASIGTLVLINVSGDVKESAKIVDFYVTNNNKKGTFFEYGPVSFVERINNTGNVHFKPSGEVIVRNTFGKQVASLKINDPPGNILPNSIRKFGQNLKTKNMFGRYKATLTVLYGSTNKTMQQTISFWVIPYKLIAAILLGIIILFILLRFILKGYKKHVLKQGQANNNAVSAVDETSIATPVKETPVSTTLPKQPEDSTPEETPENKEG